MLLFIGGEHRERRCINLLRSMLSSRRVQQLVVFAYLELHIQRLSYNHHHTAGRHPSRNDSVKLTQAK